MHEEIKDKFYMAKDIKGTYSVKWDTDFICYFCGENGCYFVGNAYRICQKCILELATLIKS